MFNCACVVLRLFEFLGFVIVSLLFDYFADCFGFCFGLIGFVWLLIYWIVLVLFVLLIFRKLVCVYW